MAPNEDVVYELSDFDIFLSLEREILLPSFLLTSPPFDDCELDDEINRIISRVPDPKEHEDWWQ